MARGPSALQFGLNESNRVMGIPFGEDFEAHLCLTQEGFSGWKLRVKRRCFKEEAYCTSFLQYRLGHPVGNW